MDQDSVVKFLDMAEGPFKLCKHKINVKRVSIDGMF